MQYDDQQQGHPDAADLIVPFLPAFFPQADLGLIHNHSVKHVPFFFCHCLHLGLHKKDYKMPSSASKKITLTGSAGMFQNIAVSCKSGL